MGLEETGHPESLFLDVTGLGPLFGGEAALVEPSRAELRARVANPPGSGRHSRRSLGRGPLRRGRRHARRHDHRAAGESLSAVARLPIAALRLIDDEVRLLADLGLVEIGQLQDLPRSA